MPGDHFTDFLSVNSPRPGSISTAQGRCGKNHKTSVMFVARILFRQPTLTIARLRRPSALIVDLQLWLLAVSPTAPQVPAESAFPDLYRRPAASVCLFSLPRICGAPRPPPAFATARSRPRPPLCSTSRRFEAVHDGRISGSPAPPDLTCSSGRYHHTDGGSPAA